MSVLPLSKEDLRASNWYAKQQRSLADADDDLRRIMEISMMEEQPYEGDSQNMAMSEATDHFPQTDSTEEGTTNDLVDDEGSISRQSSIESDLSLISAMESLAVSTDFSETFSVVSDGFDEGMQETFEVRKHACRILV